MQRQRTMIRREAKQSRTEQNRAKYNHQRQSGKPDYCSVLDQFQIVGNRSVQGNVYATVLQSPVALQIKYEKVKYKKMTKNWRNDSNILTIKNKDKFIINNILILKCFPKVFTKMIQ